MTATIVSGKKDLGIDPDGTTDYTDELLYGLGKVSKAVARGDYARLKLPPGPIKFSSTLNIVGTQGGAPEVVGSGGRLLGTRLIWAGPPGGLMVHGECFNFGLIQGLLLDGQGIAGRCLHISGSRLSDPSRLEATSGFRVRNIMMVDVQPGVVGNGCFAIGTDPAFTGGATYECADAIFENVFCRAEGAAGPNMKAFGIKMLSAGNCKNFQLHGGGMQNCDAAVDWTNGSGFFNISGISMAEVRYAYKASGGQLSVVGGDIECGNVGDFRLLWGTGQAGCSADIRNLQAFWQTGAGVPGVLLEYAGSVGLFGNSFGYGNSAPFIMRHAALGPTVFGSFESARNWYIGCGYDRPYLPLWDTSGNDMAPVPGYGLSTKMRVKSFGDFGGVPGAPLDLIAYDSDAIRLPHLAS